MWYYIVGKMSVESYILQTLFEIPFLETGAMLQHRDVTNYWQNPQWSKLSKKIVDENGQHVIPSHYKNSHCENILAQLHKQGQDVINQKSRNRVFDSKEFWQSLLCKGVAASVNMNGYHPEDVSGMQVIRNMMKCVTALTEHNQMRLEPFQLKAIRAGICSSGERLLGKDLYKYIPNILHTLGLSSVATMDTTSCSELARKEMMQTFHRFCKPIVTVIAPRRNGKSKAGKLFVAANVVSERGARIVLMAHRLEAILLYKSEVKAYLEQILMLGVGQFEIHSSLNEIRIDFPDRTSSFIFFVSGGVNVSDHIS